mgnify:CR=1 FL=1
MHPTLPSDSLPTIVSALVPLLPESGTTVVPDCPAGKERAAHISRLLPSLKSLEFVLRQLHLPTDGEVPALKARLLPVWDRLHPFLLVAELASHWRQAAIEEVACRTLTPDELTPCHNDHGKLDRLLLALRLFETAPECLQQVGVLDQWLRLSLRQFTLVGPRRPLRRLGTPRGQRRIQALVDALNPLEGDRRVRVHTMVARPSGALLIAVSAHPSPTLGDLEYIHLEADGQHLRLAKERAEFVHPLAERIASEHSVWVCRYEPDRWTTCPGTALRLVDAAIDGDVPGLHLLQVEVGQAPLAGGPTLVFKAHPNLSDLGDTVRHFETAVGPLTRYPTLMSRVRLSLGGHHLTVHFPDNVSEARFKLVDQHLDVEEVQAMREFVNDRFGPGSRAVDRIAG